MDSIQLVVGLRGYVIGRGIDSPDDMHVGVAAKLYAPKLESNGAAAAVAQSGRSSITRRVHVAWSFKIAQDEVNSLKVFNLHARIRPFQRERQDVLCKNYTARLLKCIGLRPPGPEELISVVLRRLHLS